MATIIEELITYCQHARSKPNCISTVETYLRDKLSSIATAMATTKNGGIEALYVSDTLTVLNVVWQPRMMMPPHNHNTWAVIGVYVGQEDNTFWRRLQGDTMGRIEQVGSQSICAGEVIAMPEETIHSVKNPINEFTGAIHIYGANFFSIQRSKWDSQGLREQAYSVDENNQSFES
ncbi:hypothetical protein NBRC116494_00740 [Aurantivibrio plasticivorans]